MSDTPWPPEGTRVRVRMPAGDFDGVLKERYENDELEGDYHWVWLDIGAFWAYQRHEIEVIDEQLPPDHAAP